MSLDNDVKLAIEKNLPAQTAGILKEYIETMELLQKNNIHLHEVIKEANKQIAEGKNKIEDLRDTNNKFLAHLKEYGSRELSIKDAETKILIANKDREKAEAVSAALQTVTQTIFSNRKFSYLHVANKTDTENGYVNGQSMSSNHSINESRSITGED